MPRFNLAVRGVLRFNLAVRISRRLLPASSCVQKGGACEEKEHSCYTAVTQRLHCRHEEREHSCGSGAARWQAGGGEWRMAK